MKMSGLRLSLEKGEEGVSCYVCGQIVALFDVWLVVAPIRAGGGFWPYCSVECLDKDDTDSDRKAVIQSH